MLYLQVSSVSYLPVFSHPSFYPLPLSSLLLLLLCLLLPLVFLFSRTAKFHNEVGASLPTILHQKHPVSRASRYPCVYYFLRQVLRVIPSSSHGRSSSFFFLLLLLYFPSFPSFFLLSRSFLLLFVLLFLLLHYFPSYLISFLSVLFLFLIKYPAFSNVVC